MYESHWQLASRPFDNTSDTKFYYPSEVHQGAILKLRYALESRRGSAVLTGATGMGKTLLVHALARQLPKLFSPLVHLVFPQMPSDQLLAYLADELTGEKTTSTPTIHQSVRRLEQVLTENAAAGRHAVAFLDEAQLLTEPRTLETIRLLLNFEHESQPTLTVVLVGQPSLLPVLDRTPELNERLGVKCLLRRFTADETAAYVSYRLNQAGAKQTIFTADAVETLHELSQGIPRRINRLCDLALFIGFAQEQTSIQGEHIAAVADELVAVSPE